MSSTIDTTKCILLHAYVPGKEQLIKSIKCNYLEHTGFPCSEWIDTFFTDNLATLSNLTHFAFMYDNNRSNMALFPRDVDYDEYFGKFFTYFLDKLVALNSGIIIDIITCNIETDQQKARIAALETQYNVDIRYSLNETGNYNKGGDWLMESDNVNIKDTYFNANINDWNHVLNAIWSQAYDDINRTIDVSGNRVIFAEDISGNEVNPIYDLSDNVISAPTGRVLNKSVILATDKVNTVFSVSDIHVSTWDRPVRSVFPIITDGSSSRDTKLYEDGTLQNVTTNFYNPNGTQGTIFIGKMKNVWSSSYYYGITVYAGIRFDGSCIVWGGNTIDNALLRLFPSLTYVSISSELVSGVVSACVHPTAASTATAILKQNGSVVTCGQTSAGGNMSYPRDVSGQLQSNVRYIIGSGSNFLALKTDGTFVIWGNDSNGGHTTLASSGVSGLVYSNKIKKVYSLGYTGYTAVDISNNAYTWSIGFTGNIPASNTVSNVVTLRHNLGSVAFLKSNGSVECIGSTSMGTASGQLQSNVMSIYACTLGYGALKRDGSFVTWGSIVNTVSSDLQSNCIQAVRNETGFNVLKSDGSVVIIGDVTTKYLPPSISGLLASGVKKLFNGNVFLRFRDPVAESPSNRLTLVGPPVEKNFLSISNNLISP